MEAQKDFLKKAFFLFLPSKTLFPNVMPDITNI